MGKKLVAVLSIFVLAVCISVFVAPDVAYAKPVKINVAHIFTATHPATVGLEKFKAIVEEKTNNQVAVDIYHSGVLGGDVEELQQVIAGSLDAAIIMGISIWQGYDPRAAMEEIPFLFQTAEGVHKALDGEFGNVLAKDVLEPVGVKVLAYWENGFRHFTNNKRSIVKPEDMSGFKIRSAESQIRLEMFKNLNASAIPMAFPELFTGLQQGTVDGQENPLAVIESSKFYEVQKYLSLSGHIYNAGVFIINPKLWGSLTEEQRSIIQDAANECRDYERNIIAAEEDAILEKLKAEGMIVNEVDKEAFLETVKPVWDMFIDQYGSELIDLAIKSSQ